VQRVKQWLYNHAEKRTQKDKVTYVRKWHWKQVLAHKKKAEVEAEVRKLSGSTPGSTTYIQWFQQGLNNVAEAMSEAEYEEISQDVKEWNNKAPPPEV
jgi:hypothetical protein